MPRIERGISEGQRGVYRTGRQGGSGCGRRRNRKGVIVSWYRPLYLAWGLEWMRDEDTKGEEPVEEACDPILTSGACREAGITRESVADKGLPSLPHSVPLAQVRIPGAVATTL